MDLNMLLKDAVEAYARLREKYLRDYALVTQIRDVMKTGVMSCEDMTNFTYILREMSRLANDLRKEIDGVMRMLEGVCCAKYVVENDGGPIRASLATGSPKCTLGVRMPREKTEPELYYAIMEWFGISQQVLKDKTVKAYWPGICEKVSALAEEGKALPPGLSSDRTYPTYSLTVRGRKTLDEVTRALEERRTAIRMRHEQEGKEEWKSECIEILTKKGK